MRRRQAERRYFFTPDHECTGACLRAARTRRLHADNHELAALNGVLAAQHCLHGYRGFSRKHRHDCNVWRAKHGRYSRDVKLLHSQGIR